LPGGYIWIRALQNRKIIISGDKHLQQIKKYVDIEILSPREFIELYNNCWRKNFWNEGL